QPYNPYVTVDHIEQLALNDGVGFDGNGPHPQKVKVDGRRAIGRREPFAASLFSQAPQGPNPPLVGQPQTTFFRHNGETDPYTLPTNNAQLSTLSNPFHWLVHLDRQLISPMELLHVSGFKPHELTQEFIFTSGQGPFYNHRAPWFDVSTRLYRV